MSRITLLLICLLAAGCSGAGDPGIPDGSITPAHDGSLRTAALDYSLGTILQEDIPRLARVDLLIVPCAQFWGPDVYEGKMAALRQANPDLKIVGYLGSKHIPLSWGELAREDHPFLYDMYQAARPYWTTTTAGDTLMDWPGTVVFDFMDRDARRAILDVFTNYQRNSSNKFDGVFWDYFSNKMWIAPAVTGMEGDPDLDRDGVPHWDDADEIEAFLDSQDDWVDEMRAALGPDFIQIANGVRALQDSTFAAKFDGMFYELFPNVGFGGGETFRRALDPTWYNNLWAAHNWPKRDNGGPWLILSHSKLVGSYQNPEGAWEVVNTGDLVRAVALLTDATCVHYDGTGLPRAGLPEVEVDLGAPLGPVVIDGDRYLRHFERGRIELEMGAAQYPVPFSYVIPQNGDVVDSFGEITESP